MSTLRAICKQALPRLRPDPLTKKEDHDALFVEGDPFLTQRLLLLLEEDLLSSRDKLLFSGHVGSGKSTELYHLKRQLEGRHPRLTVIYFSVKRHVNLVGADCGAVLEGIAGALAETAREHGLVLEDFEDRVRQARETYRRVRRRKQGWELAARLDPDWKLARADVSAERTSSVEDEWELVEERDAAAMAAVVNHVIAEIRRARPRADLLLLVDDLEKLDLASARKVFQEGTAIAAIDAATVVTIPIALLYSELAAALRTPFSLKPEVLPVVQVRGRDGAVVAEGTQRLRQVALARVPDLDSLLSPADFERIALASGGVVRDLVRLLHELTLSVAVRIDLGGGDDPATAAEVEHSLAQRRNEFLHEVPMELVRRMAVLHRDPDGEGGVMDGDLARLLGIAAALEYANTERWFRVHPLAEHLIGRLHAQ